MDLAVAQLVRTECMMAPADHALQEPPIIALPKYVLLSA